MGFSFRFHLRVLYGVTVVTAFVTPESLRAVAAAAGAAAQGP